MPSKVPTIPRIRLRAGNGHALRTTGTHVLYWMIANRRGTWNFSLQRAAQLAQELQKPLVILEPLRCDYRWASDRIHGFVLEGMRSNAEHFSQHAVTYYPYVEPQPGASRGLLSAFSETACAVVTDDFPCFFLPTMIRAAARQLAIPLEIIDSNGLLPMRAANEVFSTAHAFRRFLQRHLPHHLTEAPVPDPLHRLALPAWSVPRPITERWPAASASLRSDIPTWLAALPIDHTVRPTATHGGSAMAYNKLQRFLENRLDLYAEERNQPERHVTSELSPYLHFGHLSVHQVFQAIASRERWSLDNVASRAHGSREGWWGMSPPAEAYLDELVTWRELGYNLCWQRDDYDQYESLPRWAQETLAEHEADQREYLYSLADFENAHTHDPLWNAAQRQLQQDGVIHNYLRMLWGKKILEWTARPQVALDIMIELNNKYALDGRNPNSYSGIFWVLGRYDRAWGPERPIYGKIRYMTSDNTARKVRVKDYLQQYGPSPRPPGRLTGRLFD